jgi:hypothetical protein
LCAVFFFVAPLYASEAPWGGDRTAPVHRLRLVDEFEDVIFPAMPNAMPFSVRNTCGACHNYDTIHDGFHFNALDAEADPGRDGEPWIWVDPATGTQLPLSYRNWENAFNPNDLGITPWRFTQLFGRHMPGGGASEPADDLADPLSRWEVSGKAEINCLVCHNASARQDHSEWARQMGRENFRWAATASSGLGDVGGMASRLKDTWDIFNGTNPDDRSYAVAPSVEYDITLFDSKHRTYFEVADKPDDKSCLLCHSATSTQQHKMEVAGDIHTTSGMQCIDCHRSDGTHDIVRAYETESAERDNAHMAEFSCAGCHIGTEEQPGGRLGAPFPEHKGLPPIHFDKMTCTACHSGVDGHNGPEVIRTSRANRLGIHGRAQWYTDAPHIVEPVLVKGKDGKIAPHRMMWPAFWVELNGDEATPLLPDTVAPVMEGLLDTGRQAAAILNALTKDPDAIGVPVLVLAGQVYQQNSDGNLESSPSIAPAGLQGPAWMRDDEGQLAPLVVAFDAAAEEIPYDTESVLINTLKVLATATGAPGKPVLHNGNKLYHMVDGLLETADAPGGATATMTWLWDTDAGTAPLLSDFVYQVITETKGADDILTELQLQHALAKLATEQPIAGQYGYVAMGKLLQLRDGGAGLTSTDHDVAKPVSWPVGHDVRPAQQSLGAKGCTECHDTESQFFFGDITPRGPLQASAIETQSAHEFQGVDENFEKLFGWTFTYRPLLKATVLGASGLLAAIILIYLLAALSWLCRRIGKGTA